MEFLNGLHCHVYINSTSLDFVFEVWRDFHCVGLKQLHRCLLEAAVIYILSQNNLLKKFLRIHETLETWSGHLVRGILDNPVYCGKIAYGRRTREKVKGTKCEYKQIHTDDYILEDGQHEGIVSEELWQRVHAKRVATGIKQQSKIGKDRAHLLSGVLKCSACKSPMYTNKHAWTNKDGTYKEVYYYVCSRNRIVRGHHCDYKASLRKTDIEPLVIEAVRELVSDKYFAREIKDRIGIEVDTGQNTACERRGARR